MPGPCSGPSVRTGSLRPSAVAATVFALSLAALPTAAAGAAPRPTRPAVSDLEQSYPMVAGQSGTTLPTRCNLSWPTKAWPPKTDATARAHELRPSDVPAGLRRGQGFYATNGPDIDQLAVGWPHVGLAEVSFSPVLRSGAPPSAAESIDEYVGRARSVAQATATYRTARDVIYGSCARYWPGLPRYSLPGQPSDLFAYQVNENVRGFSQAWIAFFGHRGRFVFSLSVGNQSGYGSTSQPVASLPTPAQFTPTLDAALARLGP